MPQLISATISAAARANAQQHLLRHSPERGVVLPMPISALAVLRDQHVHQQGNGRDTLVNDVRRHRCWISVSQLRQTHLPRI